MDIFLFLYYFTAVLVALKLYCVKVVGVPSVKRKRPAHCGTTSEERKKMAENKVKNQKKVKKKKKESKLDWRFLDGDN